MQGQCQQAAISSHKKRLYSDLPVTTSAHHKILAYFRCRLDTTAKDNMMSVSVYKKLYDDYSLTQFEAVEANVKVYISTDINVIVLCVFYHHAGNRTAQALSVYVTDIEGSVFLSCTTVLHLDWCQKVTSCTRRFPAVPHLSSAKLMGQMYLPSTGRCKVTMLTNQSTTTWSQTQTSQQLFTPKKIS